MKRDPNEIEGIKPINLTEDQTEILKSEVWPMTLYAINHPDFSMDDLVENKDYWTDQIYNWAGENLEYIKEMYETHQFSFLIQLMSTIRFGQEVAV